MAKALTPTEHRAARAAAEASNKYATTRPPDEPDDVGLYSRETEPAERTLWRAVLAQAVRDATGVSSPLQDREIRSARRFLLGIPDNFAWVCQAAGFDPNDVKERAYALKMRGWPPLPKGEPKAA